MVSNINITGLKLELGDDIKKYINSKVGRLDRYISRHDKSTVHAEVKMLHKGDDSGNIYECEVVLHLPGKSLVAKDSTVNMFAAVDIVEAKLKNHILKYKQEHAGHNKGQKLSSILKFKNVFNRQKLQ